LLLLLRLIEIHRLAGRFLGTRLSMKGSCRAGRLGRLMALRRGRQRGRFTVLGGSGLRPAGNKPVGRCRMQIVEAFLEAAKPCTQVNHDANENE
jgi:hypothetical protein